MKILYVCGIVPEWPQLMRTLPPLDSGAPHGNIFRLIEELSEQAACNDLKIKVLSAIAAEQVPIMQQRWPAASYGGDYEWVVIPKILRKASFFCSRYFSISGGVLRRLTQADSLQALYYIRNIKRIFNLYQPDLVILDDAPQFIKGLLSFVTPKKLAFYCRGDMGISRKYLHIPRLILVTNEKLGQWLREINPQIKHIRIVGNSLSKEYDNLPWKPERFRQEKKRIIFVGRLEPVKGLEYLIKAFAMVVGRFPTARLIIAGGSLKETGGSGNLSDFENKMRTLAAESLPPGTCHWLGWLDQSQLVAEYQKSYMAVYPSILVEGFGMVALEAMACGLPVIAADCPGFASLLAGGRGILLEDPKDIEKLASAIFDLMENPDKAISIGYSGFKFAKEFSSKKAARDFLLIIESLDSNESAPQ